MAKHHRNYNKKNDRPPRTGSNAAPREATVIPQRRAPVVYGKPFILMEDAQKVTFTFKSGTWTAHAVSIAEYRESSQVKLLPQKVNGMSRYEVRCPVSAE